MALQFCQTKAECVTSTSCTSGMGGCCAKNGETGTHYDCPSGCTYDLMKKICDCGTVSGLTDTTGTYEGTSCTTEYSTSTIECYMYYNKGNENCTGNAQCKDNLVQ